MANDPLTVMGAVDKMLFGPTAQSEDSVSTRGRSVSVFSSENFKSVIGSMIDAAKGRVTEILAGTPAGQEAQQQIINQRIAAITGSPWTWAAVFAAIVLLAGVAFGGRR